MRSQHSWQDLVLLRGVATGGSTVVACSNLVGAERGLAEIGLDLEAEFAEPEAVIGVGPFPQQRWRPVTRRMFEAAGLPDGLRVADLSLLPQSRGLPTILTTAALARAIPRENLQLDHCATLLASAEWPPRCARPAPPGYTHHLVADDDHGCRHQAELVRLGPQGIQVHHLDLARKVLRRPERLHLGPLAVGARRGRAKDLDLQQVASLEANSERPYPARSQATISSFGGMRPADLTTPPTTRPGVARMS